MKPTKKKKKNANGLFAIIMSKMKPSEHLENMKSMEAEMAKKKGKKC